MPRTRRLHKRFSMVRRNRRLSIGSGRSNHPLFHFASAATGLSVFRIIVCDYLQVRCIHVNAIKFGTYYSFYSIAFVFLLWKTCRRRPRSILQTRLQSLSSDTAIIDEKGVICSWHSDNSVRYVEIDRVTTVWRRETHNIAYRIKDLKQIDQFIGVFWMIELRFWDIIGILKAISQSSKGFQIILVSSMFNTRIENESNINF